MSLGLLRVGRMILSLPQLSVSAVSHGAHGRSNFPHLPGTVAMQSSRPCSPERPSPARVHLRGVSIFKGVSNSEGVPISGGAFIYKGAFAGVQLGPQLFRLKVDYALVPLMHPCSEVTCGPSSLIRLWTVVRARGVS